MEHGHSLLEQNRRLVTEALRRAVFLIGVLVTLIVLSIILTLANLPQEWQGAVLILKVTTVLVGLATGFAWLLWRGERENEQTERHLIEDGDIQGWAHHQHENRMRSERPY